MEPTGKVLPKSRSCGGGMEESGSRRGGMGFGT